MPVTLGSMMQVNHYCHWLLALCCTLSADGTHRRLRARSSLDCMILFPSVPAAPIADTNATQQKSPVPSLFCSTGDDCYVPCLVQIVVRCAQPHHTPYMQPLLKSGAGAVGAKNKGQLRCQGAQSTDVCDRAQGCTRNERIHPFATH